MAGRVPGEGAIGPVALAGAWIGRSWKDASTGGTRAFTGPVGNFGGWSSIDTRATVRRFRGDASPFNTI